MTFGQRVALIRKQRNLTQKDVGAALGIVADVVSKYERDSMVPSIEVAAKFAQVLNVSLDYLVLGFTSGTNDSVDAITYKLQQLEKLSDEDKGHVMAVIEAFLTKEKVKALIG